MQMKWWRFWSQSTHLHVPFWISHCCDWTKLCIKCSQPTSGVALPQHAAAHVPGGWPPNCFTQPNKELLSCSRSLCLSLCLGLWEAQISSASRNLTLDCCFFLSPFRDNSTIFFSTLKFTAGMKASWLRTWELMDIKNISHSWIHARN